MESNQFYQRFKQFEKKGITEAKFNEHYNHWSKCRSLKTNNVMKEFYKKERDFIEVLAKLISVDNTLWQFSQYDSYERIFVELLDELKEEISLRAGWEYEDKIQNLERQELKEQFKKSIHRRYEAKKNEMENILQPWEEELQEFREWLQKERKKAGVTPYRGKGVESMKIFQDLIGELGELLNPHFRGNPGVTTPHLVWPCAKAIAELLNSYFVNLKVNFNADQVRKSFDSYIEKN